MLTRMPDPDPSRRCKHRPAFPLAAGALSVASLAPPAAMAYEVSARHPALLTALSELDDPSWRLLTLLALGVIVAGLARVARRPRGARRRRVLWHLHGADGEA